MARRGNRTKFAVLGLLSLRAHSGYEIKKQFERELMFFWNESYGQIYPTLKRLVEDDLATVKTDQRDDQHDRKLYSITDQGRQALASWLREPAHIHSARHETLLKLFFGASITPDQRVEHIERMQQHLLAQRDALAKERDDLSHTPSAPHLPFHALTLSYGELVNAAALQWCEETLTALAKEDP